MIAYLRLVVNMFKPVGPGILHLACNTSKSLEELNPRQETVAD
jgi:hypothetical protein